VAHSLDKRWAEPNSSSVRRIWLMQRTRRWRWTRGTWSSWASGCCGRAASG